MTTTALISRQRLMASPLGPIRLIEEEGRITRLSWGREEESRLEPGAESSALLELAEAQLDEYFRGHRDAFDLPLAPRGTAFQQKVWKTMSQIPHGETWSYAALARRVDNVARAVGQACGANPIPIIIPCHRVLAENGALVGFSAVGGTESKSFLLELEGARPLRLL
ncbi:methylated-DNA--[protein]-cysteine S-methyltransferase [Hypericibacter sp.]|uniref:methylated-DNA--[protein]-cysteine S-methyltransferase n=1 Tax=Hypericibacter sp. TaxID=2705401 RepID=UPI003D6D77AA